MGKFEVTFAEWDACVAASGWFSGGCKHRPDDEGWGKGMRSVIDISWNDAKEYASWLAKKTGKPYRLLSEAEWEYSARAGTTTAFSTGRTITTGQANLADSTDGLPDGPIQYRQRTVEVGSFQGNAFGLHDMHGNVWEWVQDCYKDTYAGALSDGTAASDEPGCLRVLRGGSWYNHPREARSAYRVRHSTDNRATNFGFRLARTLNP